MHGQGEDYMWRMKACGKGAGGERMLKAMPRGGRAVGLFCVSQQELVRSIVHLRSFLDLQSISSG